MDDANGSHTGMTIRPASWPDDEATAMYLLQNYARYLSSNPNGAAPISIHHDGSESVRLSEMWSEPNGVLLLAFIEARPAGCVGVKARHDRESSYEVKRLWVEDYARGHGFGRRLAKEAIAWANLRGASMLLLDTVPAAMPQAFALYRSLGFTVTERYNNNAVPGLQFLQLRLR